jgi:thiol-disulfide isomerase/thioredoxin
MPFVSSPFSAVPKGLLAIALALGLTIPGVILVAQGTQSGAAGAAKTADPRAKSLLQEVAKAYKALGTYTDQGQFVIAMTIDGKEQKQVLPLKLTFVRPNKMELDAGPVRVVSDGKTLTTAILPLKRYTRAAAPEEISFETFRQGPTGAVLFGGPSGPAMFLLLSLLTSSDAPASLAQLGGSLQLAPEDNTAPAPALLIDQQDGPDIRLGVDPATKLLSRIDFQVDPQDLARRAPAGQKISVEQFGWISGAVETQLAKNRSFSYEPPKEFAKVESLLERRGAGEEPKFAVNEMVGKPAPDFTLTVLDGPDKTRTVTKAELAGKVVVLNFWATWCAPCIEELPEIQKLVESLAKDKKEVVLVALSQDSEPREIGEVRKLVEKTLSEKKIELTGNSVGQIGLDPSGSVGQAFDVEGFPTILILDGNGTVQSAHVGFDPDIREKLKTEIDTLLSGKPLFKSTSKEAGKKPAANDQS